MSGTIPFPPNPTDGQLFSYAGVTWEWSASKGVWQNANQGTNFMPIAGGTFTGAVTLAGNATLPLQPTTLQQVQAGAQATLNQASDNIGRNLLHNGLMNIWQRGSGSFTTNAAGTADRWFMSMSGDTLGVSQGVQTDAGRAQIGDEACQLVLNASVTSAGTAASYSQIYQSIEGVRRLSNKTIIVSFWAYGLSGITRVGVGLQQNFGSGGSPSPAVDLNGQSVSLTGSWARYSVMFSVPSVSGKTIGTNNNDSTQLVLWFSAGANYATQAGSIGTQSGNIGFWGIQLEVVPAGSTVAAVTPLEKLDPRLDLHNCLRFYQNYINVQVSNYTANAASGTTTQSLLFNTPMRAAPTATTSGVNYGNANSLVISPTGPTNTVTQLTSVAAGNIYATFQLFLSADL